MKKVSRNDMVFDRNMNPAWCNSPESCRAWLQFQLDNDPMRIRGYRVRTGWPQRLVTVGEYLRMGGRR